MSFMLYSSVQQIREPLLLSENKLCLSHSNHEIMKLIYASTVYQHIYIVRIIFVNRGINFGINKLVLFHLI